MKAHFVTEKNLQHGDFPWCHVEWLSNPDTVGADKLLLVRAIMPAGEAHNFHRHPAREEIIYVLEVEAEQWVGDEKRILKAGEMADIPLHLQRDVAGIIHFFQDFCDALIIQIESVPFSSTRIGFRLHENSARRDLFELTVWILHVIPGVHQCTKPGGLNCL